jgi:CelD/BcsL family acetyltransferase involved in cellulose biosynthesis
MVERPELGELAGDWDRLALVAGTPFLTHAWLQCWRSAFGRGDPAWLLLLDRDGSLRAGAFFLRLRGRLISAANVHSGDWNALARDEQARAELWSQMVGLGCARVQLQAMPERAPGTRSVCQRLRDGGYRVVEAPGPSCPWLRLPDSWELLMARTSSGLRSQLQRRRRALQRSGSLAFRTVAGGPTLDAELDGFFALEAAGWKGRAGTAIVSRRSTERLYREFAHAAAERGWLRLNLLELDGALVAASYDCVFAGEAYLLKTTFSEPHGRFSPGLVLLADVLRSCIERQVRSYDFLGEPDAYKTRWTSERRPRTQIYAYRGLARPGYAYRRRLRPLLKRVRDAARTGLRRR